MLENKKLNMLISLLIAIALWAFVIGEINPQATRVYRDIPIKFLNEEVVENNGMAVYSVSNRTLNVTLTGSRSEINQISEKDISATVDLDEAISYGDNQLKVTLKVPSKVDIENQSLEYITVSIDEWAAKDVEVRVRYTGEYEKDKEPLTIDQSIEKVTVSGAAGSVDKIEAAEAVVDVTKISGSTGQLNVSIVPIDKNGQRVYGVDLSETTLILTTELAQEKTVPLKVSILDKQNGAVEHSVTVPEEITIKGRLEDLEKIETITTEEIDIRNVKQSTTIDIKPILPEGIEVSSKTEPLLLVVQVLENNTKTLELSKADLIIEGLDDKLDAEIKQETVTVELTARESLLKNIEKEDVKAVIQLGGLDVGQHKATLSVSVKAENVDSNAVQIQVKPEVVTVVIDENKTDDEMQEIAGEE